MIRVSIQYSTTYMRDPKSTMKLMTSLLLLGVFFQGAHAANDEASLHNVIRDALSFGRTIDNLGPRLNKCYEFSKQNRPTARLPLMQNNSSLRSSAARAARSCTFAHSDLSGVGENLFVGTTIATSWTLENAINDWADEARILSYPKDASAVGCSDGSTGASCRAKIGHYTQMMWASTTQVGCAIQSCPNGVTNFSSKPSQLIFCHYSPQGNYFNGTDYLAPYSGQGVISPNQACTSDLSGSQSVALGAIISLLLSD
jgi:hypothetical protein